MSEYKRLTNKDWEENYDIFEDVCCDTCTEDCGECKRNFNALVRLAELEDKIDNGTLIDLPCKVGDTVWWVNGYRTVPRIEEYKILALTIAKDNKIYLRVEYGHFTFEVDELYFTKEQAEAKLKELQEKQK